MTETDNTSLDIPIPRNLRTRKQSEDPPDPIFYINKITTLETKVRELETKLSVASKNIVRDLNSLQEELGDINSEITALKKALFSPNNLNLSKEAIPFLKGMLQNKLQQKTMLEHTIVSYLNRYES